MNERVWYVSALRDLGPDVDPVGFHLEEAGYETGRVGPYTSQMRARNGFVVKLEEVGGPVWAIGPYDVNKFPAKPPAFRVMSGHIFVNAATRRVLLEGHPGTLRFHEITLLNKWRSAPVWDAPIYLLNIGNTHETIDLDLSVFEGSLLETSSGTHEHNAINGPAPVVNPPETPYDIWVDARVPRTVFVSDALAERLGAVKLAPHWPLAKSWKLMACPTAAEVDPDGTARDAGGMDIHIRITMTAWATEGIAKLAARALPETLRALDIDPFGYEVSILACNDDDIAKFNATFRDKPVPTNVLSWPASEISLPEGGRPPPPEFGELGDIAIAFGICAREAREQGKPLQDHVTHMLVHGLLHCLGYDHIRDADAQVMEETERAILARLGIPDPY